MSNEYRPAPMSLAQRAALRRQQPRTLRQPARRRVYPLAIALILIVLVVVVVGGFEYLYRDRIYPKVAVPAAGLNVGGQTQAAAAQQLRPFALQQRFRVIALLAPGHPTILIPAHTLGYTIDGGLTAWRAYNVGHNGSLLHRVQEQFKSLSGDVSVDVAQRVNQAVMTSYLFSIAPKVARPARPGVAGRRLDVVTARRRLAHELLTVVGGFKYTLPFIAVPPLPRAAHHSTQHKTAHHSGTKK